MSFSCDLLGDFPSHCVLIRLVTIVRSSRVDGTYGLKTIASLEVANDRITHIAWSSWRSRNVEPRKSFLHHLLYILC